MLTSRYVFLLEALGKQLIPGDPSCWRLLSFSGLWVLLPPFSRQQWLVLTFHITLTCTFLLPSVTLKDCFDYLGSSFYFKSFWCKTLFSSVTLIHLFLIVLHSHGLQRLGGRYFWKAVILSNLRIFDHI